MPSSKINALLKKYPFISEVLMESMEPLALSSPYDLSIRIEKADGDLMFRQADNIGLVNNGACILFMKGPHKDHVGRCGEYLFAIDANGRVINRLDWPRVRDENRGASQVFGWQVLWGEKLQHSFRNPLHDRVKFLVWLTITSYHRKTGTQIDPFGGLVSQKVEVTVFEEPDGGFDKLQNESSITDHIRMTSHLQLQAVLDKDFTLLSISGRISELCTQFQDSVYFNGMQEIFRDGEYRGASGQFGPVKVMIGELCGYERIQLEDDKSYVTFQIHDSQSSLYVMGVDGTLPQIRNLVRTVINFWNYVPDGRDGFTSDKDVHVL